MHPLREQWAPEVERAAPPLEHFALRGYEGGGAGVVGEAAHKWLCRPRISGRLAVLLCRLRLRAAVDAVQEGVALVRRVGCYEHQVPLAAPPKVVLLPAVAGYAAGAGPLVQGGVE